MEKFCGEILFHTKLELKDQGLFDSMPPFYSKILRNWQTIKDIWVRSTRSIWYVCRLWDMVFS